MLPTSTNASGSARWWSFTSNAGSSFPIGRPWWPAFSFSVLVGGRQTAVKDLMSLTLLEQPNLAPVGAERPLIDRYGRRISYLRVSVTDRCDFRCVYCMSENMTFLPKKEVLSFEEI